MKKERLTQIALLLVGLFNLALVRFLYRDLWHSNWLLEGKNEIEPMFLSVFVMIGLFLLLAIRRPSPHRSMIAFIGWWNIAHSTVMMVETVQSYRHHIHRNYDDVILFYVIGVVLLVLLPTKTNQGRPQPSNSVKISHPAILRPTERCFEGWMRCDWFTIGVYQD